MRQPARSTALFLNLCMTKRLKLSDGSMQGMSRPRALRAGQAGGMWSVCRGRAWELCSWRGLASLPSRPMGELMRRRCDSVDAYVSLFRT